MLVEEAKKQFEKSLDYLKKELTTIRSGRASRALVEEVLVDYYGAKTPLKQLANIEVSGAQIIIITPYDKNSLKVIEKAILSADLGVSPAREGDIIRINVPSLTEERRREMVKIINLKVEEAKISIRNIREEIWRKAKNLKQEGKITEDEMYKVEEKLNETVDEFNKKIKGIGEVKEKEIMTV